METCSKHIQHSARQIGKTYRSLCDKPLYKDGLCQGHYNRAQEKAKTWIERDTYRAATTDDLIQDRSLKLRDSNKHELFMCRNGAIKKFSSKDNKYIEVGLPANANLFCVLDF